MLPTVRCAVATYSQAITVIQFYSNSLPVTHYCHSVTARDLRLLIDRYIYRLCLGQCDTGDGSKFESYALAPAFAIKTEQIITQFLVSFIKFYIIILPYFK